MGRSIITALVTIVIVTTWHYSLAQSSNSPAPNTGASGATLADEDPVRCFDNALRDEQNALQAYQIITGSNWRTDFQCQGRASAPELDSCWSLLLQIRPMIEAAADDYERARRVMEPTSGQLVHEGNSVIQQAAVLWEQARLCFAPIFDRWTKNGGRYGANQGNE